VTASATGLIAARAAMGVSSALIMPAVMAILTWTFTGPRAGNCDRHFLGIRRCRIGSRSPARRCPSGTVGFFGLHTSLVWIEIVHAMHVVTVWTMLIALCGAAVLVIACALPESPRTRHRSRPTS
jgi:hypothetical protein